MSLENTSAEHRVAIPIGSQFPASWSATLHWFRHGLYVAAPVAGSMSCVMKSLHDRATPLNSSSPSLTVPASMDRRSSQKQNCLFWLFLCATSHVAAPTCALLQVAPSPLTASISKSVYRSEP